MEGNLIVADRDREVKEHKWTKGAAESCQRVQGRRRRPCCGTGISLRDRDAGRSVLGGWRGGFLQARGQWERG